MREAEIRSAQQEVWREAARLVLTGDPIKIARQLHERAEMRSGRRSAVDGDLGTG